MGANPQSWTNCLENALGIEIGTGERGQLRHDVASLKVPWGELKLKWSRRVAPSQGKRVTLAFRTPIPSVIGHMLLLAEGDDLDGDESFQSR